MDREILKEVQEMSKEIEEKIASECIQGEEEEVKDISSKLGSKELHVNPPKRNKWTTIQQQHRKKAKAVKLKKNTP